MIFELLVGAGLVLAGAAAARTIARRRARLEGEDDGSPKDAEAKDAKAKAKEEAKPEPKPKEAKKKKKRTPRRPGPRGLLVDDVLLYADSELWLAGMLELDEEGFVARLFPTPGGVRAEWVAQLDEEGRDLATLRETREVPAGPVPESLPIEGRRLSLERRGHAEVTAAGENLPRTEARGRYTILSDSGGRVLVVLDFDKAPRLALVGDRVAKHLVDLLPGGDNEKD